MWRRIKAPILKRRNDLKHAGSARMLKRKMIQIAAYIQYCPARNPAFERMAQISAQCENGQRQPINPAYPVQCLHDADRLRAPRPLHQRWQSANAELAHEYAPARRRAVRSPSARGL